jgi:hypothetical protein
VHPHFSGDGSQYFVAIFQFHPEHSIAQGFQNYSILFNQWLFRHTIFGAAKILVCSGNKKIKWKKILKMWKNPSDFPNSVQIWPFFSNYPPPILPNWPFWGDNFLKQAYRKNQFPDIGLGY